MAFLRNRTVNLINLHYGIHALANGMGGVFILVFLLRVGLSVPEALCAIAVIYVGRFVIRPLVVVLAKRWGMKPIILIGTIGIALPYPALAEVDGIGLPLLVYCLLSAVGETFYWSSYHAYFAALGDSEHRGHQVSAREAFAAVIGIVAPLIGAAALVTIGPRPAFVIVGLIQALSAIPLFGTPNVTVQRSAPGAFRSAILGSFLFMADGWLAVMYLFVWQIALFYSLSESFEAYGGAMSIAALVAAVSGMLLGRHFDAGNGWRVVMIGYAVVALTLVLRAVSVGIPWLAVSAHAIGAIAVCLQPLALMPTIYNLAKASPCPLRFQVAAEGGWDIGCAIACLIAAGLVAWGVPLSPIICLGLLPIIVTLVLLSRHYQQSGEPLTTLARGA